MSAEVILNRVAIMTDVASQLARELADACDTELVPNLYYRWETISYN
jgi:hypothetical protein